MSIVNCTSYTVKILDRNDSRKVIAEFPPSGFVFQLKHTPTEPHDDLITIIDGKEVRVPTVSPSMLDKNLIWPTPEDVPELSDENATIIVTMPVGRVISEIHAEIPYNVIGIQLINTYIDRNNESIETQYLARYRSKKTTTLRS